MFFKTRFGVWEGVPVAWGRKTSRARPQAKNVFVRGAWRQPTACPFVSLYYYRYIRELASRWKNSSTYESVRPSEEAACAARW